MSVPISARTMELAGERRPAQREWLLFARRLARRRTALFGLVVVLAVVVAVFPVERRGRALALFFGVSGALTAIGPLLGGWLTASWTWRAVFWVNVPVAVVALVLTALAHIADRRRSGTLDVPGAALIVARVDCLGRRASVTA